MFREILVKFGLKLRGKVLFLNVFREVTLARNSPGNFYSNLFEEAHFIKVGV